jgi:hypothetical protein
MQVNLSFLDCQVDIEFWVTFIIETLVKIKKFNLHYLGHKATLIFFKTEIQIFLLKKYKTTKDKKKWWK